MIYSRNRFVIIAAFFLIFLAGYGAAFLVQSDSANRDEKTARVLTLKSEVSALHKTLEKRLRHLDKAIVDARASGKDAMIHHLAERQELIQRGLERRGGREHYMQQISQAADHVRNHRFEDAINVFSQVRLDLYKMLDDIASAEYLLIIEPRVKRLRDIWRSQKKAEFSATGGIRTENEIEAEAGYLLAVGQLEAGELYEALWVYRQLASDYQTLIAE